jgi:PKD repeat protein
LMKRCYPYIGIVIAIIIVWLLLPSQVQAAKSVAISSTSGKPGSQLVLNGSGFTAGATGFIWFDTNNNNIKDEAEYQVSAGTSSTGTIPDTILTVPFIPQGVYSICIDIPSGDVIDAIKNFSVIPGLTLSPPSTFMENPVKVNITGGGFSASTPGVIWFDTDANKSVNLGELSLTITTTSSGDIPSGTLMDLPGFPPGKSYFIRADIPADGSVDTSASFSVASTTKSVTVTKYDAYGNITDTQTLSYLDMKNELPVQGDGNTRYYCEGPYFDTIDFDTLWDTAETGSNIDSRDFGQPQGTSVKDLCDLVGGASLGDTIAIKASDGLTKEFDYESVYNPPPELGKLVVCWYNKDFGGYVPDWGEGMRLLYFVEDQNPDGKLVFGNWDMHQTLPRSRWYYYNNQDPSSGGISVKYVYNIEIHEPKLVSCDSSGNAKHSFLPGETVYVKGNGLTANSSFKTWIQPEPVTLTAYDSLDVPTSTAYSFSPDADPSGNQETVTTDPNGNFAPTAIWNISQSSGSANKYDIVADNLSSGTTGSMDTGDFIDNPGFEGFNITPSGPTANFNADIRSGVVPLTVHFNDQSAGSPDSWSWDFQNDGSIDSTLQNPDYTYSTVGNFSVSLKVSNPSGSDEILKTNYIVTTNNTSGEYSDWDVNCDGVCNQLDVQEVQNHIGETGAPGWIRSDVNRDGVINILDVSAVAQHFDSNSGVPAVSSFSPTSAGLGSTVVISGTYFTGATSVKFGGTPAESFIVNSASQITAVVGSGSSGSVSVTTSGGTATKAGFTFVSDTMTPEPTITSFSPTSAGMGASITVFGTNLTGTTAISFGGIAAQSYIVNSVSQITAVVGSGSSGIVSVTTPGGTATKDGFAFIAAPTIASFSPTSAGTGTAITIYGTNFTGATSVKFGGTAAQSYSVTSSTVIASILGNGSSGSVTVTTPGGTATRSGFAYISSDDSGGTSTPAPTITSFSPASARTGDSVTIYGTNFSSVSSVSFGGIAASSYTVNSTAQITAVIGSGASGYVRVVAAGGTASMSGFTFTTSSNTNMSLSISPGSQTVSSGNTFDVSVLINTDNTISRGANLGLTFDSSILQCIGVEEGSFFKNWAQAHNCSTILFPNPDIDNTTGTVSMFSIAVMGQTGGGPSGSGVFCIFHMQPRAGISGQSLLTINNGKISNETGYVNTGITINNGQLTVTTAGPVPALTPSLTPIPVKPTGLVTNPPLTATPSLSPTPTLISEISQITPKSSSLIFNLKGLTDSLGTLMQDYQEQQTDPADQQFIARLDIRQGTRVLNKEGQSIESISLTRMSIPDNLKDDKNLIALFECSPDGCQFSQPVSLTIKYNSSLLSVGVAENNLALAYYDSQQGRWEYIDTLVDSENHVLTANLRHFSKYAIVVKAPSFISWNMFVLIIGPELAIGIIIVLYFIRRRRLQANLSTVASGQLVGLPPAPSLLLNAGDSVQDQAGLANIEKIETAMDSDPTEYQSIDIDNSNDCNEIVLTIDKDEAPNADKNPLKITLNKNPKLGSDSIVRIQIVKRKKKS